MSGSKEWNTKEIREFKSSFNRRNDIRLFSSEPPHDPSRAYQQSCQMLEKRRTDAQRSFEAILGNHEDFQNNSLLIALQARGQELSDATDSLLQQDPGGKYDMASVALVHQADQWVAFEARCVSANNDMTTGKDDAGVRKRLADRAAALSHTADFLDAAARQLSAKLDLSRVKSDAAKMMHEAGADGKGIEDTLHFGDLIERYTAVLRQATKDLAQSGKKSDQICKAAVKLLYGLDIVIAPKDEQRFGAKWSFPYEKFIDALGMVPADHTIIDELTKVVVQKLDKAGGDYSAFDKQIRIDPLVDWNFVGKLYTDPESEKWTLLDTFTALTLHEIGHAVDAAYDIMGRFGKNPGCGKWEETHPIQYMVPQYSAFCLAMDQSGIPDDAFHRNIKHASLKSLIASVAVGNKSIGEAYSDAEKFWDYIYDEAIAVPLRALQEALAEAAPKLMNEVQEVLPQDREADVPEAVWDIFEHRADVPPLLATLTHSEPPVFARGDFIAQFGALVLDPTKQTTDLFQWVFERLQAFNDFVEVQTKSERPRRVALWADATIRSLPKPVDLKRYLSGASPWTTDLSNATINDLPASHEAYKGDSRWWRYGAADRQGTFVSNYQWRAPGEWFAELYAITWFKKVEPPAAVGKDVRQYLFGGHVTPDQAV